MSSLGNGNGNGKSRFWRSLAELEDQPEFRQYLEREFPEQAPAFAADPLHRRRFMQLMGASLAFAGVAGGVSGCRWEEEKILPLSRRPEDYVPGDRRHFATALELGGVAAGVLATSFDGRPIKVEGNPQHPSNGRGTSTFAQASILELYDPDRSTSLYRREDGMPIAASWTDFREVLEKLRDSFKANSGKGLRILSEATSSPTIEALKTQILSSFRAAKWHEWTPLSRDNERDGTRAAFGAPHRVHYDLSGARVVVTLDADLVVEHPDALRLSQDLMEARKPDEARKALEGRKASDSEHMNRIFAVESTFSATGALADHRLPVRAELILPIVAKLHAMVTRGSEEAGSVNAPILEDARVKKFVQTIFEALRENRGRGVVAAGYRQPPEVHALVARINSALANTRTVSYSLDPEPNRPSHADDLAALTKDMRQGKVDTLIILGGNPVYDAPADLDFAGALAKVNGRGTSIHLSSYRDETSAACGWHVPRAHYLESWGDTRTWDGTVTLVQPLVEPIHGGKSPIDLLKVLVDRGDDPNSLLVQETFKALTNNIFDGDKAWKQALHDGFVDGTAYEKVRPTPGAAPKVSLTKTQQLPARLQNGELEVVLMPSASTYDGRFANNAWMQELPDFMTKVTWDNCAIMSPRTAEELGVEQDSVIEIEREGRKLELPVYVQPGQAPFSIAVALGYGRTRAGSVGGMADDGVAPVGADSYRIRTQAAPWILSGIRVKKTGKKHQLASTQNHWAIDDLGAETREKRADELVRAATLKKYTDDPDFITNSVHVHGVEKLLRPTSALRKKNPFTLWTEHSYDGYRWAMATDLSKCIGCNACVVACQAENNIPVVGPQEVINNREMHWIRIDRYFKGDPEDPEVAYQPLTCQQCENAPCEQVCPVGATIHSTEGLNDMSYNRCVGTRYCMNNCPYKVRRFNYHYWWQELEGQNAEVRQLQFNPDVTVRSRGVMEKCTYCVQRIQKGKIEARNERRRLKDGEVTPACAQACPTEAIVFGDLNDPKSRVNQLHEKPRAYAMLAELATKPRNAFLARINNPHPALTEPEEKGEGNKHG